MASRSTWPSRPAGPQASRLQASPGDGGATESLGHFAVLECYDYACYNTLDVNFYASWALLLLWPDLDVSVVRDFAATVDLDDPEIVTVGWKGTLAPEETARRDAARPGRPE